MEEIKKTLLQALQAFANRDIQPFDQTTPRIYNMDFSSEQPSDFPVDRFQQTEEDGVLYRPEIVAAMKTILLTGHERMGLFVRGPQGVGTSHSLVNLVRSLRADGHIVTFIPTCEDFITHADFLIALLKSIESSMSAIGVSRSFATKDNVDEIMDGIEEILPTINKHWFFVFDQVNRIFARGFADRKDVGALPPPFFLMKSLNNRKRMMTVISASANNNVAYKDNHPGFLVYDHPTTMSQREALLWKPDLGTRGDLDCIVEVTGLCPLQVSEYLKSPLEYTTEGMQDVLLAVQGLLGENTRNKLATRSIKNAAVHCLLSLPIQESVVTTYDRKYSVLREGHIEPLYPLVLVAYRYIFWDEMLDYIEKNESSILKVCRNPSTTNDVRGRLFELMVIVRFRKDLVLTHTPDSDVLPAGVDNGTVFESQELPTPHFMNNSTLFIPKYSNFPAIDLILKSDDGVDVWAVQVHVSKHDNVLPKLESMCKENGWFEAFTNIYLVYLSPSDDVKNLLTCLPKPSERRSKRVKVSGKTNPIQVSAATIHEFECLRDMQWTAPLPDDEDPMKL